MKCLLVIECQEHVSWSKLFAGHTLFGEEVKVVQAAYPDIAIVSYHDSGAVVSVRGGGTHKVDFVFLRSVTRCKHGQDSKNTLLGLIHAGLPAVNTLMSAYMALERPLMFAELKKIQRRLGAERFPLISQTYYPSYSTMNITPELPLVCKVGHAHSGFGKMKIEDPVTLADFRSLCAIHGDYVTMEPYIKWSWDGRVQKIGDHIRVFKRVSMNWKGNVGNSSIVSDGELTPELELWINECARAFGGLDICGLDFVCEEGTGKLSILELNDTAIGLVHKYAEEDMGFMRDLVLRRMAEHFGVDGGSSGESKGEVKGKEKEAPASEDLSNTVLEQKLRIHDLETELQALKDSAAQSEGQSFWSKLFD
mmetsp:Transcript_14324/g.40679  ORF Transcript_14324/g.40679 Transcript_14324/m.40679 type:complete len:365 (-) Transcript_14324:43-1137(-)